MKVRAVQALAALAVAWALFAVVAAGSGSGGHDSDCDAYNQPCPQNIQPICAARFQGFSNKCELRRHNCKESTNYVFVHDGFCAGDPQT